jgi:hypothetical protein
MNRGLFQSLQNLEACSIRQANVQDDELRIGGADMAPLGTIVGSSRASLADPLRSEGEKHGIAICPRLPAEVDTNQPTWVPPANLDDDVTF